MSRGDIRPVLALLSAGKHEQGWKAFLAAWSDLIYTIVLQYERDEHRAEDCYLFVCGKLAEDGFARLLKFNPEGPASFKNWLATVAAHLCVDWHRSEFGRFRELSVIRQRSDLEKRLFGYRFKHGMSLQECRHALQTEFTGLSTEAFHAANAKLNKVLSSEQHWRLASRHRPLAESELPNPRSSSQARVDEDPSVGPEQLAESDQDRRRVERALDQMESRQRLMLLLRYRHGLTLEQIAHVAGMPDLHYARRAIERALTNLEVILSR